MREFVRRVGVALVVLALLAVFVTQPATAQDTRAPTVSWVWITSDAGTDNTYAIGDSIEVEAKFSEIVTVTGTPQVEIDIGGEAKQASYTRTNLNGVFFSYTVQAGDADTDGITIGADKITLNGGTIQDSAGNDAVLDHAGRLIPDRRHLVDAAGPTVSRVWINSDAGADNTYVAGDSIVARVTFDEGVRVTGTPRLELDIGGVARTATWTRNDFDSLSFSYTVQAGDADADGIAIGADKITLNGGTIRDSDGIDAVLDHAGILAGAEHLVDAVVPTVSSVAITSRAGADNTYVVGDSVVATATFSESVSVTGTPRLEFDVGGVAKTAAYTRTDGAEVVFSYTVQAGDADADGIAIGADKITLNGGSIQDSVGNDAVLSHAGRPGSSRHMVDTAGPTVSAIEFTSAPKTYTRGDVIFTRVTFNEEVVVVGSPRLELDIGGEARNATYTATHDGGKLIFNYVVATGDVDDDGIAIGADKITLNGGTIRDRSGNNAILTHDSVAADSTRLVSAPGGV